MKTASSLITLFILSGCGITTSSVNKSSDNAPNKQEYHSLVNELLADMNRASQVGFIESNKAYWQAYDHKYPNVSPVFYSRADAEEYAYTNNFNRVNQPTGHEYVVRQINHRFEVRLMHDDTNDVLYMSDLLYDAKQYVAHYEQSHSDIYIYDLVGQNIIEPPRK